MSLIIQRALRRQRAIQESRGMAWFLLLVMLTIAVGAGVLLYRIARLGAIVSPGGFVSLVVALSASWVARHLFREARRLGRLLRYPEQITSQDGNPDLMTGLRWSALNPFSSGKQ